MAEKSLHTQLVIGTHSIGPAMVLGRLSFRRWQFSLRMMLLSIVVVAVVLAAPGLWRIHNVRQLQVFAGVEIASLAEADRARLQDLIQRLFANPDAERLETLGVWSASDAAGNSLWLVVQGRTPLVVPGSSTIRIASVDWAGRIVNDQIFGGGSRFVVTAATWHPHNVHGFSYLQIGDPDWQLQFYALIDQSFELIRIEDDDGRALHYVGYLPGGKCSDFPQRTASAWEAALQSASRAEVLRTLLWLEAWSQYPSPTPTDEEKVAIEVRSKQTVRATVERLASDSDNWISSAAESALIQMQP